VRFKIVPEAVVRALELRKGTVDLALNALPPDMVEALRGEPDLEVSVSEGTNYQYLAFNLEDEAFRDVRVRQAIAHAINRTDIVRYLWRGQARLADSVLPPGNWAYADSLPPYAYDPARARSLLEAAGHPRLSVTYRTSTDETGRLVASVLQRQLADVGIDMEIRSNEFATFYADVIAGNFQMYSLRWIGGNNDPDIFNFIFHSRAVPPEGANRGHYANPDVDRWIEAARRATDMAMRRAYYRSVQEAVAEDLPYVSLWYLDNVAVYNRRVRGVELDAAGSYEFLTRVWLDDPSIEGEQTQ
jgi:peptide/nickel transport system substrate-binding protein